MIKRILLTVLLVAGFGFSGEFYISNYSNTYWFRNIMVRYTDLKYTYTANSLVYVIKKENNNSCWYEEYNENSSRSKFLMTFQNNKLRTDYKIEYDSSGKVFNEFTLENFNFIIPGTVGESLYEICRDSKKTDYQKTISNFIGTFVWGYCSKLNIGIFDSFYKYDSTKNIKGWNKDMISIKYNYDDITVLDIYGRVHIFKFAEDGCVFDSASYSGPKYFQHTEYSYNKKLEQKERVGVFDFSYNDIVNLFDSKKEKYHKSYNSCSELFYTRNK